MSAIVTETLARPEWKREADLVAAAALAGYELIRMPGGDYVCSWGLLKALPDLDAAAEFLLTVGALKR